MKKCLFVILLSCLMATPSLADGPNVVQVESDERGARLKVDGKPFMVLGMNWGYIPVGNNYSYDLWGKSDEFIKEVLERELRLLSDMGANAIRQYDNIPPKWVTYIYKTYGIYTAVNPTLGRYGHSVDGAFVNPIDYSNPSHRKAILASLKESVSRYHDTPGVLMWLLGNESNYGLHWTSFEIEALPEGERNQAKAKHLYTLFGDAIKVIKAKDTHHPISLTNGDLQYLDLIKKHCHGLDIMGSNVYRGRSATDLYARVWKELRLPFVYTEFGADAYNSKTAQEDHLAQASYLKDQWREIYEQSYGKGQVGNAIGGFVFQWSDGWWKYKQETNLDVHDTNASWPADAYPHDFMPGKNNMNEEWWGICAKAAPDETGHQPLYPRAAYYVLKEAFRLNPYADVVDTTRVREHFGRIDVDALGASYSQGMLSRRLSKLNAFRISNVRMEFDTMFSGGKGLTDDARNDDRFDHRESFYLDVNIEPMRTFKGTLSVNLRGNRPSNLVDEIFYEDRDEILSLHGASFSWDEDWFKLEGYYRTGHYHWGYEGDFFGLYREAYYGKNIDMYQANAPFGFTLTGKDWLKGLTVGFGPEVYWGANPAVFTKYYRTSGPYEFALLHQEDVARRSDTTTSVAIPEQMNRKSTAYFSAKFGIFRLELGAIMAGTTHLGKRFVSARKRADNNGYLGSEWDILEDEIELLDTLGGRMKISLQGGGWHWYAQGGYQGIVADGGEDRTVTFTGWKLKQATRGNHWGAVTGLAYNFGKFQIAPAFLYQKPLEGPLPLLGDFHAADTNIYYPGVRPRNVLDDPFAVLGNREQTAFELMFSYDQTPGTWMWAWDNEKVENANFAMSLNFVYRMLPTSRDSSVAVFDGFGLSAFGAAPPANDVWEAHARFISNPGYDLRLVGNLWAGENYGNSGDDRLVMRYGGDLRLTWNKLALATEVKFDDWGPYDYHRDFNLTFPFQWTGDLSWALVSPKWLDGMWTKFGIRAQYRTLDEYSPRVLLDKDETGQGAEYEVRTYVHTSF